MADDLVNSKGLRDQKERKWEEVQIKAFKMWVNGYLEPLGYVVEDISEDFKSGVNLCFFLEQVSKKKLTRWSKKPAMRVHKIENVNIALQYITKDLGVRLVGIGAEDIADGQMKLTLGMLWSLFKRLRIEVISEEGQSSEMGLLAWLKKMTADYEGVDIKNFKESFNDGLAFSALINAMDPEALDFYSLDPSNIEGNLQSAFEIAESKLGIPKLLEVDDLVSGNVDERAVILYSSMFFHAYVADEEKRKLVEQKKSIGEQIKELKEALEREKAEKERLLEEQKLAAVKSQRNTSDKDALIARLRAKIKELMEEIEFLKKKSLSDAELRALLESKIKTLKGLMDAAESIEASMVDISQEDLLEWLQKVTENYENVTVEDFKESFSNGMVLSALIHAMDNDALDFASVNPENSEENVTNALQIAQDKLNIPAILNAKEVCDGTVNEGDVVAYTTQFLKKYIADNGSAEYPPKETTRELEPVASKALVVGSKKFTKKDLLSWAQTMTADYENVNVEDFKNSFSDGLAFSAIINSLEPTALDFASLDVENAEENLKNAFSVAEAKFGIPCSLDASAVLNKTADENDVAAYTSQFYQKYVAESELFGNPNVGKVGSTPNPIAGAFPQKLGLSGAKFSPEDLLSWVKSTTEGYPNVNIESFKESFNDGMALAALVHAMDPSAIDFDTLNPENSKDNVNKVLIIAENKFGIPKILDAETLSSGNASEADIVAYNAQFFQKYMDDSGLFATSRSNGVHGYKTSENDLLNWTQKVTEGYENVNVRNFTDSFNDGLAFSAIVNSISPEALDFAALNPENVKENVENVLTVAEQKFGVPRLVSAEDLMNGKADERDIIAYNAKLFSKYLDEVVLNNDSKYATSDLLSWAKKMTDGYDNVEVNDFSSGFSNGMALSALVHAMDPSALDFDGLNPEEAKANLNNAMSIAERRFGIDKFENSEALLNGSASEDEVVNYVSKFLDTYIAEAGKYGVANSKTRANEPFAPENDLLEWAKKVTANYDNVEINDWKYSFADGLAFSAIVNSIKPGSIDVASLDPEEPKSNILAAFDVAETELGVPKLLNPDQLIDGECDERDIIAYTSSLFRKYLDEVNTQQAPFSKDDLLNWAQKTTASYENVNVTDFKDSFKDGLALSALVHAMDPSLIDYNQLSSENGQENIEQVLRVAEKKFGIPQSLDAAAVASGDAPESEIVTYTGNLFKNYLKEAGKFGKYGNSADNVLERGSQSHVTTDEVKENLLADLESRKQRLLGEIEDLQKGIKNEIALRKKMAEEITFLKQQAYSDSELRSILEQKVSVLESLVEGSSNLVSELSEQQHNLSFELEKQKKRGEELGLGVSELETERNQLITDAEEKGRRLRDLEERRKRLMDELADLQTRVKKEIEKRKEKSAEIASLKTQIQNMTQKQIVQSKARVGLDTLKKNLEDHLEDLYQWRDLHEIEMEEEIPEFDLKQVISDISSKSFEEQLEYLDGKLQEENRNLSKIINLKEDKDYLDDVVIKAGWLVMKGHKEWKRRWFQLSGNRFSFYEDDTSDEVAGSILLDQGCDVVRHKAIKEDENSNKKVWPLKVSVGDKKLFVRAASKKERHSWFAAISSKIAHLNYAKHCNETSERPDSRLVGTLNAASAPNLDVSQKQITDAMVAAIVKGIPGRDELELINLQSTKLSDQQFTSLCEVFEKLNNIKSVNLSDNELTSEIVSTLLSAFSPEILSDLDVSGNKLDDAFLEQLSGSLVNYKALNSLNLNNCLFSASGVSAFSEAFANSDVVLQDLSLAGNKLGDDGASALSSLFEKKTFKRIFLAGNGIGDEGASSIAAALANSSVEEIDLSNNNISSAGALALKSLMENNDNLHTLNLSSNAVVASEDSAALLAPSGLQISSLTFTRN